jgi:hypothetical protein
VVSWPYKGSYGLPPRLKDMAIIDIAQENLMKLEQIRKVVHIEDGVDSSIDEILSRVLSFYRMFVPYD